MNLKFMVVDDDPLHNKLSNYTITRVFEGAEIKRFERPAEALKYILSEYSDLKIQIPTILFLDINMPEINGWDFLNIFEKMDEHIHKQFTIYIVSSSIDPADKEKADANIFVKSYLPKPLGAAILKDLL